jgi:hypothetical protein
MTVKGGTGPTAGFVGVLDTDPNFTLDVNGNFGCKPAATVTPVDNGHLVIEATSNTSVTLKLKGTDGIVRSVVLTLA